ncbi:zinc-binding dehydrogenase [uncultured Serinicoccus sp.]|uniref:zinc-binding dehydrogenase n=1 Tax=uncultured Serinicoccus sp. TaxID=735514 RepID=UPI0026195ED2|nr:zinc-binding dehydrogenase [uncultured Serinicoccus sp.]
MVQIARHLGAGIIIGTTRSRENASELLGIGFTAVLGGSEEAVAGEVGSLVEGGVDLVIDMVGGSTINSNVLSTAIGGRIVHVGRLGGTRGSMNLDEFARRQITMKGVTFRTRSLQERIVVTRSFERMILPLMAAGVLRPRVAEEVGLEAVLEAERLLGRARRLGKVTLTVS